MIEFPNYIESASSVCMFWAVQKKSKNPKNENKNPPTNQPTNQTNNNNKPHTQRENAELKKT